MNLLLSRLDEQQRRGYVALESQRVGHGGDRLLYQITGMNVETIRQGRWELDASLQGRPGKVVRWTECVWLGAVAPPLSKRTRPSRVL